MSSLASYPDSTRFKEAYLDCLKTLYKINPFRTKNKDFSDISRANKFRGIYFVNNAARAVAEYPETRANVRSYPWTYDDSDPQGTLAARPRLVRGKRSNKEWRNINHLFKR